MTRVTGDWLTAPGAQAVLTMLEAGGHRAYAVGGCVRNALLGEPVADVDVSTDARPERVIELARAAGLRAVPTGIDHGTVTIVANGTGYEVTTFRADIETDGRRAVVRFADDVAEDAVRRDFTMNALYVDRHGEITDPLGGLPDLMARRLRFIEDADRRIREDYLRILRFFRFYAWYGDPQAGVDADALAAIAANLDGLETLSRERVGQELLKLFAAPDPLAATAVMARAGVLQAVLPGASETPLGPLLEHETTLDLPPDPLRRLAAIGAFDGEALRFSKVQKKRLEQYQGLISDPIPLPEVAYRFTADMARDVLVLRAATFGAPLDTSALPRIKRAAKARFPVAASDLKDRFQGPALGEALRRLEAEWIASDFALDKATLLSRAGNA
ncbi:CCA tRNA nucleotidyltransferase [Sagittula stellata]|uniref:PolyA polymerase family protein n=1 Tax=Sagittula stellata (strain ATCC 700073 / DSM 11524 / E-37) TaxID=388399 RepID=A3K2V3_SAGS3|nr:CCA tRNA nucleotidyltransferase [Sagittula stellata]EBA08512.1 polyA polymerase family protein [Sagittula stellata E-37]